MFVHGAARSAALAYVAKPETLPSDQSNPELPGTAAVTDYLTGIKSQHYALLALLTQEYLKPREGQLAGHGPDALLQSPFIRPEDTPFERLRDDSLFTLTRKLTALHRLPFYSQAARMTNTIGNLDGNRHIDIEMQMRGGLTTAVDNMAKLLESLPALARHHNIDLQTDQYGDFARQSVGLPWTMAMMCINRMMTLQGLIAHKSGAVSWGGDNIRLDPQFFRPNPNGKGLRFIDLKTLEAPAGYTPHLFIKPFARSMKLGEVSCHQEISIGCPITLLPKRLHMLWNWLIDIVEQRELWHLST